jgi:predicted DNA-binding protein (MmcQ/YjbR family)
MDIESLRDYCLSFNGVTEGFPFGEDTLVFYVHGKVFCLAGLTPFDSMNLKCEPEVAIELREKYDEVIPGYHMNKKHWNTVFVQGRIPEHELKSMIKDSYNLVVSGLPKKIRAML